MSDEVQIDSMIAIKKIIDKAGIDGALTEDAIEYFNRTIADNKDLRVSVERLANSLKSNKIELDRINKEASDALFEVSNWRNRENELSEREKAITTLELRAQHESQRVTDHKEMFTQVFRNIETRRNVFTPLPGATAMDQYGTIPSNAQSFSQENEEKTNHD